MGKFCFTIGQWKVAIKWLPFFPFYFEGVKHVEEVNRLD